MVFSASMLLCIVLCRSTNQAPYPGAAEHASSVGRGRASPDDGVLRADWVLAACDNANSAAGSRHSCEAVITLQLQGQRAPFAQVAFGHLDANAPLRLVVALPVSVVFPSTVKIEIEEKDSHPLELAWKRCLPGACFADAVVGNDVVGRWRGSDPPPVHLRYVDGTGREVVLPVSSRGMPQALDALLRQG